MSCNHCIKVTKSGQTSTNNVTDQESENLLGSVSENITINMVQPSCKTDDVQSSKTDQQIKEKKMRISTQVLASLSAGTLSISVGSNVALSSSIIPLLINSKEIVKDFETASWLATVFLIVAVPSALSGGMLSDRFGRKKMAMISCLPLITGHILMATSSSFPMLMAGRGLVSIGTWMGYPCANVLVSEVVHPEIRGTLGVFPSVLLSVGMFISYSLGYLFDSWRLLSWILVAEPIFTFICMACIKESPYWLVQHERKIEAESSLRWYRGPEYDIKPELDDMIKKQEESLAESSNQSTLAVIFSTQFVKAQLCSGVLFFWAQYTGISALVIFMINVFQDANLSFDPRLAPVLVGATRILFGVFSSFALKKGNRKYIFCASTFILSLCTSSIAGVSLYRITYPDDSPSWLGFLPFPFVLIMFMAHAFGVNPVLHIITAEVYPTAIRSLGNGSVMCMATAGNALQSFLYPRMLKWVGVQGCFFWFSCSALLLSVYGYTVIPDNRGKSLANIERGMENKNMIKNDKD